MPKGVVIIAAISKLDEAARYSHFTVQGDDNFLNFLLFDTPFIINTS
jgi:hypothetical protein